MKAIAEIVIAALSLAILIVKAVLSNKERRAAQARMISQSTKNIKAFERAVANDDLEAASALLSDLSSRLSDR